MAKIELYRCRAHGCKEQIVTPIQGFCPTHMSELFRLSYTGKGVKMDEISEKLHELAERCYQEALRQLKEMPQLKSPNRGAAWSEYQKILGLQKQLTDALEKMKT